MKLQERFANFVRNHVQLCLGLIASVPVLIILILWILAYL